MNPLYVVEELSAHCFAGCRGCFRTFVAGPRDGDMTKEIFEAANKGVPKGTMILPNFHGESLLHPDFEYFIRRYRELGLRVSIPVSGGAGFRHLECLTSEDTPVYVLILSIDGFDPRTHAVRRGSITLPRASGFVDRALELRGSRSDPWIAVRWVEGGQSEREFELYLEHWLFEKKVDFVLRSRLFNYGSDLGSSPALGSHTCRSLLEGNPVVLFNGNVLLCERVADRERYVIGNVLEDSWEKIMARRGSVVGHYPNDEPCRYCSAAYLLTGFAGVITLRSKPDVPIYIHSDHSQTFYSLTKKWEGINWSLLARAMAEREIAMPEDHA